jgi:hypothetical protein
MISVGEIPDTHVLPFETMTHTPDREIDWFQRRSDLNHNRLKNQFLMALANVLSVLDHEVDGNGFEERFCTKILPKWTQLNDEIRDLVHCVEEETAPSRWMAGWKRVRENKVDYEWLGELVDELWKTRHGIDALKKESVKSLDHAQVVYEQLTGLLHEGRFFPNSPEQTEKFKQAVIEFHDTCEEVSCCLSRFPTEAQSW